MENQTCQGIVRAILLCLISSISINVVAGTPPRVGWRKVGLTYLLQQPNASSPAPVFGSLPLELIDEDANQAVGYVPINSLGEARRTARQLGVRLVEHDEYDTLSLGAGVLDTRLAAPLPPRGRPFADYGTDDVGLYVLQFRAPQKAEWMQAIRDLGAQIVDSVAVNGLLVGATPPIASRLSNHVLVQWIQPLHAFLKAAPEVGSMPPSGNYIVEFADLPGAAAARSRARSMMISGTDISEVYSRPGLLAVGALSSTDVEQLLTEPTVIAVYSLTSASTSDERQVLAITANVTTDDVSGNEIPTAAGGYTAWLYGSSRCPACARLNADGFKVGIADSGFYGGKFAPLPTDIHSSRVIWGRNFWSDPDSRACGITPVAIRSCSDLCDVMYHGTFVAGIVAGDGTGTGMHDSGGFLMGTGVAPTAGLVITKHVRGGDFTVSYTSTIFDWAEDATVNGAFIQNHSQNESTSNGRYTDRARDFDRVVRGEGSSGLSTVPVTLTVSSGNASPNLVRTQAPATGKNVIAVGASESVRDPNEVRTGPNWAEMPRFSTLRNLWRYSAHGTDVQSDGPEPWQNYIKPDLVAPATQVAGLMTPSYILPPEPIPQSQSFDDGEHYCGYMDQQNDGFLVPQSNPLEYTRNYLIATGTSFAAPVAAGAALLASRMYSSSPSAATPALLKAILTATAHSLQGGSNYSIDGNAGTPPETIGAAPNTVQGFGRVDITDIVDGSLTKSYVNQDAKTFTQVGEIWTQTYEVVNPQLPVKIALAWSDAPGIVAATPQTLLQNDLDLSVRVENGASCRSYEGNNIEIRPGSTRGEESKLRDCGWGTEDTKNTVEKVLFHPNIDGVARFSVLVRARLLPKPAIPCAVSPCPTTPSQDFALYVQNAQPLAQLPRPTLVSARGEAEGVTVSWNALQGAAFYQVWRRAVGQAPILVATVADVSFFDSVPSGMYAYTVRAANEANEAVSNDSNIDYAWVGVFSDDPLIAHETVVRAMHVAELRSAVDQLRAISGLGPYQYSRTIVPMIDVAASDINETREAVNQTRTEPTLSLPRIDFGASVSPVHLIYAETIRTLRDAMR